MPTRPGSSRHHARRAVTPRRGRPFAAVLLAIAVVVAGVAVIAFALRPKEQRPGSGDPAAATSPAEPIASGDALEEEPSPSAPPAGPRTRFADGIWSVGDEVKPGRYKTTVPTDVFACHWERMRDAKGTAGSTIEEGLAKPGSRVTVTVRSTDTLFKSELCGTWSPA